MAALMVDMKVVLWALRRADKSVGTMVGLWAFEKADEKDALRDFY
jgi:hypothetical protein